MYCVLRRNSILTYGKILTSVPACTKYKKAPRQCPLAD